MAKILKSSLPYKSPATENLIEFLRDGLRRNENRILMIDSVTGETWTGKEIECLISTTARFLIERYDLKKGDVCSIYGKEGGLFSLVILSVVATGAACHFLNTSSSSWDLQSTSSVLKSRLLFASCATLKKLHRDLPSFDTKIELVTVDEEQFQSSDESFAKRCTSIKSLLSKNGSHSHSLDEILTKVEVNPEVDYAVIQFSSGTTGKPKPIPRTHKNLCHLVASVDHEELMDLKPGVVLTGSLPITHRPGLWALLASISTGSTFVIWSNMSNVEEALSVIQKYKVTIFSCSLPLLSMFGTSGISLRDKFDTSSLEHIITSGAKILNPELPRALVEEFKLKSLRQCFGMTESGWVFLIAQSLAKDNFLSVGHVVPGMEAVVLGRECGKPLGAYDRGELALRGPQIFPGYLTEELGVLNRKDFTSDDWFRIGDQGYYDKEELVFVEGRFTERMMFENNSLFFPTEIETALSEHPALENVCVVKLSTVEKDFAYDIARGYVSLKPDYNVTEKELLDFLKERVPSAILGGGIRMIERFPRLQNGKIDKQALKAIN